MDATANDEQIRYWNSDGGPVWARESDLLDAQLAPFSEAVITAAAPQPAERVLDVGCGCGRTSLELAAAVGPDGAVVGVDISAPMLDVARHRAADAAAEHVTFVEADAQTYTFGPTFDLAFSRFGVMFFGDPVAAFANLRVALVPGGRLTFVCWRPLRENPWAAVAGRALLSLLDEKPPTPPPDAPGPFALADDARVRRLLEGAGFVDVGLEPLDREVRVGSTTELDEAVRVALTIGPAARLLGDVDDATKARAPDVVREALRPHHGPDGVKLAGAAWIVTACT